MARTKTKPPPKPSWQLPPRRLVADPGSPRTPGSRGNRDAAQQAAYPTPDTPTKSKSGSDDRAQDHQMVKDEDRTQYGRWSSSGRSWFVNRRSIPGDRPPPPGIFYRYGRRLSFTRPRSPTPQRPLTPEISSEDSEPVVRRPRRGVSVTPSELSDDETIDDGSGIQQEEIEVSNHDEIIDDETNIRHEKADVSSDDSEPIVRRSRRRVILGPSRTSDDETIDDGSGIQQEEAEVSSDNETIDDGSNVQQEELDVSSDDSEPVIRRPRREVVLAPSEISDDETIDDRPSIQREDSAISSDDPDPIIIRRRRRPPAEALVHESSVTSNAADDRNIPDSDPGSPSREASVAGNLYDRIKNRSRSAKTRTEQTRSRSPRPSRRVSQRYRRRSPVQVAASRDARAKKVTVACLSNRRGGAAEEARMTREEWVDEELEESLVTLTSPAESEASEYGEDDDGDGEDESESEE